MACGPSTHEASFRPTGSDRVLVIERRPTHAVFAEYQRIAILRSGDQPAAEISLFQDTGGYSRANLYQIDKSRLLLRDADASYVIDLSATTIKRDKIRRKEGSFLGSFDDDTDGRWRFIPALEREELTTEFRDG
jgi:hypothetical protein